MKTKICIEDIKIKKDDHTTILQRDKGFQIIGNSTIGCGIDYVKSIVYHSLKNREQPLPYKEGEVSRGEIDKEKEEYLKAIFEYKEIEEPAAAILSPADSGKFEVITNENLTAIVTSYNGQRLFMSILVFVDFNLDKKNLVKIFKSTIDAKNAALWDMGVINHFSFDPLDLEDNESILIASNGSANDSNL